ncbi:CfaE/CblD family pilus tip adhesin (plasmid) [Pantoea allii]|uniref:CfaE/CblD family pilus tip adhesin n=1 Tax=Pantoea allii TaxID=574096 RepID=UPI003D79A08E
MPDFLSRFLPPVRVRSFVIMPVIAVIAVIALSFHAVKAADFIGEFEGVRNLHPSKIKQGTVLTSFYIIKQGLTWGSVSSKSYEPPFSVRIKMQASFGQPGNQGCIPSGTNGAYEIVRYDASGAKVSGCADFLTIFDDLKALLTWSSELRKDGYYDIFWNLQVPRKKLFDVVVNDPQKLFELVPNGSGNITIQSQISPSLYFTVKDTGSSIGSFYPKPVNSAVFIGDIQPAAFFPQQNSSHALLPLPVKPSGDLTTGSASVDLCLYDGAGLTTSRYMLTLQDQNTANTGPYFAVYNNNGTGKMDYSVSLTDPSGTPQPVTNRTPFFWTNMQNGGAAQGRLRYVQLPDGIQGLVPCVPSVVTVKVKPVPYRSLRAGNYTGHLNILFTPSTG